MPTARELLEQADALMRRNRARAAILAAGPQPEPEPEIPVLTDPVGPELIEAPAPVLKSAGSEPARVSAAAIVADAAKRPGSAAGGEFPVLTDVVEEIEAPPIVSPGVEGEPSDWLGLESREGPSSITGPAPDSIAVVPPATLRTDRMPEGPPASSPAPTRDPERAQVAVPGAEGEAGPASGAGAKMILSPSSPGPGPEAHPGVGSSAGERATAPETAPETGAGVAEIPDAIPLEDAEAGLGDVAPAARPDDEVAPRAEVEFLRSIQPPQAAGADVEGGEPASAIPGPQWEALAEEVRMQVLQRIDIFTDTGLREKLGERLKPIVDRASADLVATINQHVGDLLRAYVAEAIEREIERWRDNNR